MMGTNSVGWTEQDSLATKIGMPVEINNDEFVVPNQTTYMGNNDGLYSYNIIKKVWKCIVSYPSGLDIRYHSSSFDPQNNTVYIIGGTLFASIDLNDNSIQTIDEEKLPHDFANCSSVFVNDEFHIFGGWNQNKHCMLDKEKNKIIELHEFECDDIMHCGAVYIPTKQAIFVFGGGSDNDLIFSYSIFNKKCRKMDLKLPIKLSRFGYVLTKDNRFIILFGGLTTGFQDIDTIYIWNLETMQFRESETKCPIPDTFYAVIMGNTEKDEKLIQGFIRNEFEDISFIPNDVINLIVSWYSDEEIHLFDDREGRHWRIGLSQILR